MEDNIIINNGGQSLIIPSKQIDIEQLRRKATQSVIQLLDDENIKLIVYIDDKLDVDNQKEHFTARLMALKQSNNRIEGEIFQKLPWDEATTLFTSEIDQLWTESPNKTQLLHDVYRHLNDDETLNVIPLLEIEECLGSRVKLMTPDAWIEDNFSIIQTISKDEKVLCLFDFEFTSGNKLCGGRNGVQLAKQLIENNTISDKVVCGIFSRKFTEEGEDDSRIEYTKDYNIAPSKIYTISKERFTNEPKIAGFVEGIKNLVLLPHVEKLMAESIEILEASFRDSRDKIKEISPKTFNQIIQKSSLKEGVWEINTLFRLHNILFKEESLHKIKTPTERQKFNDSIDKIRNIDSIDTGYKSNAINQKLVDLRNSELYLSGEIINQLHLPISNGDIFEINKENFILLVQPCNLALRTKGKRNNNYDSAILVPIKDFSTKELDHTKVEIKTGEKNKTDKVKSTHFPQFKISSLNVLDLVVFNTRGEAKIDMTQKVLLNRLIHFPWIKRYEYIYQYFEDIKIKLLAYKSVEDYFNITIEQNKLLMSPLIKELPKLKEDKVRQKEMEREIKKYRDQNNAIKDKLNHIKNHVYCTNTINGINTSNAINTITMSMYDFDTDTFNMGIKRVAHYKSPDSDDLLQKFMQYLSRNAFEHDFTDY